MSILPIHKNKKILPPEKWEETEVAYLLHPKLQILCFFFPLLFHVHGGLKQCHGEYQIVRRTTSRAFGDLFSQDNSSEAGTHARQPWGSDPSMSRWSLGDTGGCETSIYYTNKNCNYRNHFLRVLSLEGHVLKSWKQGILTDEVTSQVLEHDKCLTRYYSFFSLRRPKYDHDIILMHECMAVSN